MRVSGDLSKIQFSRRYKHGIVIVVIAVVVVVVIVVVVVVVKLLVTARWYNTPLDYRDNDDHGSGCRIHGERVTSSC